MTLEEIKEDKREFLRPRDIAGYLGIDEQVIRDQAAADPRLLGFAVCRAGSRTIIPRIPFIRWATVGNAPVMEVGA